MTVIERHMKFWGGPHHMTTQLVQFEDERAPHSLNFARPFEVTAFTNFDDHALDLAYVTYRLVTRHGQGLQRYEFSGRDRDYWGTELDREPAEYSVRDYRIRDLTDPARGKLALAQYTWLFPINFAPSCTVLHDISVWHLPVPYATLSVRPMTGFNSVASWL